MFRFTIRELLLLTLVVALLSGWWAHYTSYRIHAISADSRAADAGRDLEIAEYRAQHWKRKYEAEVAAHSR